MAHLTILSWHLTFFCLKIIDITYLILCIILLCIFFSLRTTEYLMRHLAKVAAYGVDTGMHSKNLAIVWAPNLLRWDNYVHNQNYIHNLDLWHSGRIEIKHTSTWYKICWCSWYFVTISKVIQSKFCVEWISFTAIIKNEHLLVIFLWWN